MWIYPFEPVRLTTLQLPLTMRELILCAVDPKARSPRKWREREICGDLECWCSSLPGHERGPLSDWPPEESEDLRPHETLKNKGPSSSSCSIVLLENAPSAHTPTRVGQGCLPKRQPGWDPHPFLGLIAHSVHNYYRVERGSDGS